MTAGEWEFFGQIVADYTRSLPTPDLVVYVTATPTTQLARIKARGRSFESGYTLDYLRSITDRLSEYAESLANIPGTTLLTFDSEKYHPEQPAGQQHLLSLVKPYLK